MYKRQKKEARKGILTVSDNKSAPMNPVISQSSRVLNVACPIVVEDSLLKGCKPVGPLMTPFGLACNNTLPLGPACKLSFSLCAFSSASFFLFSSINLLASTEVRQPAARAS